MRVPKQNTKMCGNKEKQNTTVQTRLYLLRISFRVRKFSGHVKHDLFILEVAVDRFGSRLAVCHIQTTAKPGGKKRAISGNQHALLPEMHNFPISV